MLPDKLAKVMNTNPSGPNCWNTTQVFHEPHREIKQTEEHEMEEWLDNKTFTVSIPEVGDIAVYRCWKSGELLHTAVLFQKSLYRKKYFHKYGYGGMYEFRSHTFLKLAYGSKIEYRRYRKWDK